MVDEKICGKCSEWSCGYCYKRKKNIDILSVACDDFKSFSKYLYQEFKKDNKFNHNLEELK